jgi:signal transduction histidine kinase
LRLKFADPGEEERFQVHYAQKTRRPLQIGLMVGVVIYALFFFVDLQKVSHHALTAFFIRFALIIPMALGIIGFSYKDAFRGRLSQVLLSALLISAGASVLAIDHLSDRSPQVVYYTGMMLVIFVAPLSRMLFWFTAFTTAVLVAQHTLYIGPFHGAGFAETADKNLLVLSAAAISMVITYWSEIHVRREYLLIQDLERANMDAVNANLLKDRMVALVSHDLKDPLSAISAMVEIMKNFGDDLSPARKREIIEGLDHNVRRMMEIINLLMRLKKLRSGEFTPDRAWVPLRPLAQQALATLRAVAEKKNVALHNGVAEEAGAYADKALLSQAVQNLVSNAVRHTGAGGWVRVFSPPDGKAVVAVEDTGGGVAPGMEERIFTGTASASTPKEGEGWGMGLPLASEIVEAHGGSIWVESQAGKGSVFYISLPEAGDV